MLSSRPLSDLEEVGSSVNVPSSLGPALRAAALVTQMALSAMVGAGAGWLIDRWLQTAPFFSLLLAGAGFVGGLAVLWRAFVQAQNVDDP